MSRKLIIHSRNLLEPTDVSLRGTLTVSGLVERGEQDTELTGLEGDEDWSGVGAAYGEGGRG